MFNLAEIKDTIKIEPAGFRKKKAQAITDEINRKYANKVLYDHPKACFKGSKEYPITRSLTILYFTHRAYRSSKTSDCVW